MAAALARMGAVAGGGSEAQIEGLGKFFLAVGLAFQIIDAVLQGDPHLTPAPGAVVEDDLGLTSTFTAASARC